MYINGSKSSTNIVGWEYAIYKNCKKIVQRKGRLNITKVFDEETEEVYNSLLYIYRIYPEHIIYICLNNTAVI